MIEQNYESKSCIDRLKELEKTVNSDNRNGCMTTLDLIEKFGIGHNCLSDAYALGMAHGLDGMENAVELAEEKARVDAINEVEKLIQSRLVESLWLENATTYGNKQANSCATVMRYEIADCVDDLLDDLEQLKEKKNE